MFIMSQWLICTESCDGHKYN